MNYLFNNLHQKVFYFINSENFFSGSKIFNYLAKLTAPRKERLGLVEKQNDLVKTMNYVAETNALREKNEELEQKLLNVNNVLDQFIYRASHDLRGPVASVLGLINLAQKESDTTVLKEYLDMEEQSVLKLDSLMKDIIQFSKNTHLGVNYEEVDFEHLVKVSLDNHAYFQGAALIKKTFEVNQKTSFTSDHYRIKIILDNLISNAIKYANYDSDKPVLDVSVEVNKRMATIVVSDNGVGITKDQEDKIFEMFYCGREDNTGSGLGLYIVQENIEKLGGNIIVHSLGSNGCQFEVTIPNPLAS